jgi:hypothetical protein
MKIALQDPVARVPKLALILNELLDTGPPKIA